jgi:hypothetical protein
MSRLLAVAVLGAVLAACGGTTSSGPSRAPATIGTVATPGGAGTPAAATPGPGARDPETIVLALVPPGATEVSRSTIGNLFTVTLSSSSSLADLESFFDQKLASLGMSGAGKFNVANTLTYAFTNPDGGIVVAPGDNGGNVITISAGTSS